MKKLLTVLTFTMYAWFMLSYQVMYAQKPGKSFESPLKNFTIQDPDFPLGEIEKWHNRKMGFVCFYSLFGAMQRINYSRIDASLALPTDSDKILLFYQDELERLVKSNPGSSILKQQPYVIDSVLTLYAIVSIPGGAYIQNMVTGKRFDSTQGILVFARGGFIYKLRNEVGSGIFSKPGDAPEDVKEFKRRADISLPKMYRSMTFY